jgi:hypothetical protein
MAKSGISHPTSPRGACAMLDGRRQPISVQAANPLTYPSVRPAVSRESHVLTINTQRIR